MKDASNKKDYLFFQTGYDERKQNRVIEQLRIEKS